jgi:hypothetical protein
MHKNATKCIETIGKWCKNKHGASKIIDTFETYHGIMGIGRETSSGHHRGEALKLGARGLFHAIKRVPKTTNHAWRRLHVDLLSQLTLRKAF